MALTVLLLNSCSKKDDEILKRFKVEFLPVKHMFPPSLFYITAKVNAKSFDKNTELEKWEVTGADTPEVLPKPLP